MAKKDLMVLTNDAINGLSCKELKQNMTVYISAGNGINQNRWAMAGAIHNIVTNELYDEDFETMSEWASFAGLTKSNVSQLVNAVKFANREQIDKSKYTISKCYVLSTLEPEEYTNFCEWMYNQDRSIEALSDKGTIEAVKEWKKSLEPVEEAEEEEEWEEVEKVDSEDNEREEVIAKIKELMADYNITIEELQ